MITKLPQTNAPVVQVDMRLVDALQNAERLAIANPTLSGCIYQAPPVDGHPGPHIVCLSTDPAPAGADLLTTVTRRQIPQHLTNGPGLTRVVHQVMSNLPRDVSLAHRAVIERFPDNSVHAYQFLSTEGRNVATWMPLSNIAGPTSGALMHMGFDGRGRLWKDGTTTNEPTANLKWEIEEAQAINLTQAEAPEMTVTFDAPQA